MRFENVKILGKQTLACCRLIGDEKSEIIIEYEEVTTNSAKSPLEMVEDAQADWNAKVSTDLRQRLQDSTPEFFE